MRLLATFHTRKSNCPPILTVAKPKTKSEQHLTIAGRQVAVSNLDKVLYPESHFTKGQVIDYYTRVSEYLLPHFRNRPVTLNPRRDKIYYSGGGAPDQL